MVCISRSGQISPFMMSRCGSRLDFVRAVRALGAKTELEGHPTRTTHPRSYRVLLNCSHKQWTNTFGKTSIVTNHYDSFGRLAFQGWPHRCSDGLVLCIGRQYRRPEGKPWITVVKLYFF